MIRDPKIIALRDALQRVDATPHWIAEAAEARGDLTRAAYAAGFDMKRAIEDWARYTVAVAESVAVEPEPEPDQEPLPL